MTAFIKKIIFFLLRPTVIMVVGNGRARTADLIFEILKQSFKTRIISDNVLPLVTNSKEAIIFAINLKSSNTFADFKFIARNSRLPVLAITYITGSGEENGSNKEITLNQISLISKLLPARGFIIANFDDGITRRLRGENKASLLTYGLEEGVDFRATDINIAQPESNFKISHEGNIVPFWLYNLSGKEEIYNALAAAIVGEAENINLVEASQGLKNFKG